MKRLVTLKKGATAVLTDRERLIFEYVGRGWTSKEIGDLINIATKTVDTYRHRIVGKLKIERSMFRRLAFVYAARRWGK